MKHILLAIAMLAGTGCATVPQYQLVDPQGRPEHKWVLDRHACTTYIYGSSSQWVDMEYYYACMKEKGYALELVSQK